MYKNKWLIFRYWPLLGVANWFKAMIVTKTRNGLVTSNGEDKFLESLKKHVTRNEFEKSFVSIRNYKPLLVTINPI